MELKAYKHKFLTEVINADAEYQWQWIESLLNDYKLSLQKPEEEGIPQKLQEFIHNQKQHILAAQKEHPDKDCVRAMKDFINWCLTSTYAKNVSNYKLRFFIWVGEDRYGKYKIAPTTNYNDWK